MHFFFFKSGVLKRASATAPAPRWQHALKGKASFRGNFARRSSGSEPGALGLSWSRVSLNIRASQWIRRQDEAGTGPVLRIIQSASVFKGRPLVLPVLFFIWCFLYGFHLLPLISFNTVKNWLISILFLNNCKKETSFREYSFLSPLFLTPAEIARPSMRLWTQGKGEGLPGDHSESMIYVPCCGVARVWCVLDL